MLSFDVKANKLEETVKGRPSSNASVESLMQAPEVMIGMARSMQAMCAKIVVCMMSPLLFDFVWNLNAKRIELDFCNRICAVEGVSA